MQEADIDDAMARLARGHREAFDALYGELAPRARRFAARRLSAADAEDAAQAALMKIFARASEFTPGRPALPWFYAVVFNEVTAIARRKRALAPSSVLEALPDQTLDAHAQLEERQLLDRLADALDSLDTDARVAVTARLKDGGVHASSAARKRVSRAYGKLRLLLGGIDG